MNWRADLAGQWEQLVKVTAPTRWVVARAVSMNGGPRQHRFNATAKANSGLGFCPPYGFQDAFDVSNGYRADGQLPDDKRRVLAQRLFPLDGVLRAAPPCPVRLHVGGCAFVKALRRLGRLGLCFGLALRGLPHGERFFSFVQ